MASTLGTKNPLRYRGYVYDNDTQLYYCQSRYYDPALGRFLNADAFASTGQGILGNNMFAYCGNNPISRVDATGQAWLAAAVGGAIAGGLIGASSYLVSNGISGEAFDAVKFAKAVGIGAINGAIGGAAGTMKLIGKTVWSLAAGAIAGVYTAINTEGTIEQKILSGALTRAIAAGSTFVGASIKTGDLSPLATTFANYGITLAVGTPAEFTAVSVQTAINSSSVAAKTSSKSASSNRNRPRNYVALRV